MNEPLTAEQLNTITALDSCTVANAIERFDVRLRNEGFSDASIRCLFPELPPVVGYAVPIKIRTANPPAEGDGYPDRTDWWNYILSIPAPRLIVIQDINSRPGSGALIGEVHAHILRALHCGGVITNGAVRDVSALRRMPFQAFAACPVLSHAYAHITEIGTPVVVAGLKISPGDLLHGDQHGVQTVPLDIAARIPALAAEIVRRDRAVIELCQSPELSLEKLRAMVADPIPNPR
jgi:4-hydroxy-4-methyl-2-oxoglutarate aldolase